ncbi:hypothetical protein [Telmatospirillum siberiense]|uniref:hypothetical protein n=1 Tax=Telmatospirillum siberiense TaxID=382514 RepID=UPI0011AFABCC|nr:hypothetical protein [Telmatospirillum siberiense]
MTRLFVSGPQLTTGCRNAPPPPAPHALEEPADLGVQEPGLPGQIEFELFGGTSAVRRRPLDIVGDLTGCGSDSRSPDKPSC